MHKSSYDHVAACVAKYLPGKASADILDIGSYDVNGCYRPLFAKENWRYTGIDVEAGPNVDKVLESPYRLPFSSRAFDVVVSGQVFEHVEFFWLSWLEMVRVTRPGGYIVLLAPSRGPEHRHPVDCYRFYPDSYRALARWGGVELLEVTTDWDAGTDTESATWGDTVGVFRVVRRSWGRRLVSAFVRALGARLVRAQ